MISEVRFARDFGSFWRQATPTMDGFVRRLNSGLYERDFEPLNSKTDVTRRAFVNQVAFEVFSELTSIQEDGRSARSSRDLIPAASIRVRESVDQGDQDADYSADMSDIEIQDVVEQVRRLSDRVGIRPRATAIICSPEFVGCGLVDKCKGDILADHVLFEVKAGDRAFRTIDLRQILAYLALNHAKPTHKIAKIGLINPRVGISFEMDVEEFCYEVSGQSPQQLLDRIVFGFMSGDISR